jgi:tetratricopeptide (TPR) repeat protein
LEAPAQALSVFEQLVEDAPDDAVAHSGVAEAEFALHRYLTARTHYRRALALNPSLTHLNSRLAITDLIIALDPTVRGLGRVSRFDRSLETLARAAAEFDLCVYPEGEDAGPVVPIPLEVADQRATAREWTGRTVRRPQDDDASEQNILLAQQIWQTRAAACPGSAPWDEPLARVLEKIASTSLE